MTVKVNATATLDEWNFLQIFLGSKQSESNAAQRPAIRRSNMPDPLIVAVIVATVDMACGFALGIGQPRRVHVEHERRHRLRALLVQVFGQSLKRNGFPTGINEGFIGIGEETPISGAMSFDQ